jgi:hypothetical protein
MGESGTGSTVARIYSDVFVPFRLYCALKVSNCLRSQYSLFLDKIAPIPAAGALNVGLRAMGRGRLTRFRVPSRNGF